MNNSLKIKSLKTQLSEVEGNLSELKGKLDTANKNYLEAKRKKDSIIHQMEQLKDSKLIVTEHAILRLCERKFKMPIDKMEEGIRTKLGEISSKLPNGNYPLGDGLMAVVRGNAVITITEKT